MKNLLFYSFIFALLLSCNKKKQDNPQPTSQQKTIQQTPITPEPKYKKMTVGEENADYCIQNLQFIKTENNKDLYSLKAYSVNNKSFLWEKTVSVWWENDTPKSDYFIFQYDGGWHYSYEYIHNSTLLIY